MKIKFPILIRYPKQLKSLFEYLDSKGIRYVSGRSLVNSYDITPTCKNPYWIFYERPSSYYSYRENGNRISYWRVEDESEFDMNVVLHFCDYTECEVNFED